VFKKRAYDIKCPKGVPNGHVVILKGKGAFNRTFHTHQDLHVVFDYSGFSNKLRVDGRDVHIDLTVDLADLVYGFRRTLHLFNEQFLVETSGYIDPNVPHKLQAQGLPAMSGQGTGGDLYVHVIPHFPARLDARFKVPAATDDESPEKDESLQWSNVV
jgi:DnaJ-class molecular chaperone